MEPQKSTDTLPETETKIEANLKPQNILDKIKEYKIIVTAVLIIIILAAAVYGYLSSQPKPSLPFQTQPQEQKVVISEESKKIAQMKPEEIMVKVGEENIYKKDIDKELAAYPQNTNQDTIKLILDKMIQDSIILQQAAREKLITLDKTVYNSLDKDYLKRTNLVQSVIKKIDNKSDQISGSVVSLWFRPRSGINPDIIAKNKEKAKTIITDLQSQVKSGQLTMSQAADKIKNNTTLVRMDPNYKGNAIFSFNVQKDRKITFDDKFNTALWALKPGETSEVFLIQDRDEANGPLQDSVYMFGQVTKKISNGGSNFTQWLKTNQPKYEIIYY